MTVLLEPCLVLNRNWQAVTFLPVKVAITTVMRDMATILNPEDYTLHSFESWCENVTHVEGDGTRWIKASSGQIAAPEIVVLKRYGERPPAKISFTRQNLYRRDAWECQYCGKKLPTPKLTIDHVLPRSRGGANGWENCVAACGRCNSDKADKTPKEAGLTLRNKPAKPSWRATHLRLPQTASVLESWQPFLAREGVA